MSILRAGALEPGDFIIEVLMRTIHKIGIGVLVGLCFAGGYATKIECMHRQRDFALLQEQSGALARGTQVASSQLTDVTDIDIRPLETLYSVLKNLREHYVEQLTVEDEGKMTYDAMRAMLGSLADPNTRFVDPAERKTIADAREGKFHGIGAILTIRQTWKANADKPKEQISEEHLIVATVLPDSPAAKAGLKTGDEIVAIDGKSVLPYDPYQRVNDMLKQDKIKTMDRSQLRKLLETEQKRIDDGTSINAAEELLGNDAKKPFELTIAAKGPAKESKITVSTEQLVVNPVGAPQVQPDGYAYVKVDYFGATTSSKFDAAMSELQSKPANGLILDLRGATGSDMESARQLARWFAPNKTLAMLLRSRGRKIAVAATADHSTWGKPVVVLVNRSTTRVPEVLAAGLKEAGAAKLVGEKTYGAFQDTTLVDLADGSALLMSTGKYVTPKGVDYNGKGVPVDVQASTNDQQMKEAARLLSAAGGKG